MSANDILCRADALIARALRHEHGGASAVMQFDPSDRKDTLIWLSERLSLTGTMRYTGPPWLVVRNLVFDARQEARKSRRHIFVPNRGRKVSRNRRVVYRSVASRRYSGRGHPSDDDLADAIARPLSDAGLVEAIETLAASAAQAAQRLVSEAINSPARKAEAMLACFARLTAVVGEAVGEHGARTFARLLVIHRAFVSLPLSLAKREDFASCISRLRFDGSLRRDLRLAGLPWPSTKQWDRFRESLRNSEFCLAA
jgi:hypothetical protein